MMEANTCTSTSRRSRFRLRRDMEARSSLRVLDVPGPVRVLLRTGQQLQLEASRSRTLIRCIALEWSTMTDIRRALQKRILLLHFSGAVIGRRTYSSSFSSQAHRSRLLGTQRRGRSASQLQNGGCLARPSLSAGSQTSCTSTFVRM